MIKISWGWPDDGISIPPKPPKRDEVERIELPPYLWLICAMAFGFLIGVGIQ